jgi:amino acid adenylation domain-containing protein/non-ribosomal peptide synthase protein (TIGR01720 family)
MRVAELIEFLNQEGIFPYVDQGKLKTRSQTSDLSERVIGLIREHRDALIAFLGAGMTPADALPIPLRHDPQGPAPLSFAQQRLWFLDRLDASASMAYHVSAALKLTGTLDVDALEATLQRIVTRHESLRTRFVMQNDEPMQAIVQAAEAFGLSLHDLRDEHDLAASVAAHMRDEASTPFDLFHGPVFRARLLRTGESGYVLLATLHHIVSDGWSTGILVGELQEIYAAFTEGRSDPIPLPSVQYADYAAWQRAWLTESRHDEQVAYWRDHLSGAPVVIDLPLDRQRPAAQSYAGERVPVEFSVSTSEALRRLAVRHGATGFMVLLAGWATLLHRLSGQGSVVVGCPVANRQRAELEGLIGFFANTMPIHVDFSDNPSVATLLVRVRAATLEGYAYQALPFEQIVEAMRPERSLGHTPLFQNTLTVASASGSKPLSLKGLEVQAIETPRDSAQFDLALSLGDDGEDISGSLVYATALFERSTIERWIGYFERILAAMAGDDSVTVSSLPLLSSAERAAMVALGEGRPVTNVLRETVQDRVSRYARECPEAIAVTDGDRAWSYATLDRMADGIAARLIEEGIHPGERVGLRMERGLHVLAALLGTLRAGAAYVPLDPGLPAARTNTILQDAGAKRVLATPGCAAWMDALTPVTVVDGNDPGPLPAGRYQGSAGLDPLAYVLYTSGSTGTPKGVMVGQASLSHYLDVACDSYLGDALCGGVVATPLAFDATVTTLLAPLWAGRKVLLLPDDPMAALPRLGELFAGEVPWLFKLTPAHLDALSHMALRPSAAAHCIVVGGEALSSRTLSRFRERVAPAATIVNEYGPTEATVGCTTFTVAPGDTLAGDDTVSIGRPLPGLGVWLLDAHGEPVPPGVIGEIHIGGPQVAMGYLGRPELTAAAFDIASGDREGHPRMYRSGDVARWQADGNLRFVGRNDTQLKLRGFRIEPAEIEARLTEQPGVADAAVAVRGDGAGRRLVAYIVAEGASNPSTTSLRDALAMTLPAYMLPDVFVRMDGIPLTRNGKRDIDRLLEPDGFDEIDTREVTPASTLTEEVLVASWSMILKHDVIGIDDDFFRLGGHSMLAARAVGDIVRRLGRDVPLRAMFEFPTIRRLAAHIDTGSTPRNAIAPRGPGAPAVMSYAQKRLWILDELEGGSRQYHIATALRLDGSLDEVAVGTALEAIVERHEVLRTRFVRHDGGGACAIADDTTVAVRSIDLRDVAVAEQPAVLRRLMDEEVSLPFDLSRDRLLRAAVFRLTNDSHVAVLTLHHIVSDGWSTGVLVAEFAECYSAAVEQRNRTLLPLPIQYADYAAWQRDMLEGEPLERGLAYWRERLDGIPQVHGLPLDRPRTATRSFSGGRVDRVLGRPLSERLEALARQRQATPFMLLHAAFSLLIGRWSGEEDVVIGSAVAGRFDPAMEPLIGLFVNSLVLRHDLSGNPSFVDLLERTRSTTLDAYAHQAIPFDLLVEKLNPPRSLGQSPLFQISFTMHQLDDVHLTLPGLAISHTRAGGDISRFDIELHVAEGDDGFDITMLYATDLFDHETIVRFCDGFATLLSSIADRPDAAVHSLDILSVADAIDVAALGRAAQVVRPDVCVHALFETRVREIPDDCALIFEGTTMTYDVLNRRANQVANYLRGVGVGPDTLVGLCVERSPSMIVGLLGILKAGAAYVPLDPTYPAERLVAMLDDASVEYVLTQEDVLEAVPALGERSVIPMDGALGKALLAQLDDADVPVEASGVRPSNLAYAIFTSGSTGRAKCVLVEHAGMVNLALNQCELYSVARGSRVLAFASMSFDGAVWEWMMALTTGATLVVCEEDDRRSVARLSRLLVDSRVTHAAIPPALLAQVDPGIDHSLACLFVAGEACEVKLAWRWAERCRVVNSYGPSEGTVAATTADVLVGQAMTLGHALPNVPLRVCDAYGADVPRGVPGELLIGGPGVARGYLGLPEQTVSRFVEGQGTATGRMYRTGDRVRWNAAGELEFLGRADDQVKIRGYRVEPGEIASLLRTDDHVADAWVVVREDDGVQRLVAYVIPAADVEPDSDALLAKAWRANLKRYVPDYMVPAAFVLIDAMPLTANGKLDLRRLPKPDYQSQVAYAAPRDGSERILVSIWEELLRVSPVGIHDNFFEIGGDSILAIQVVSRANQAGVAVTTRQLFLAQTVAELAAFAGTSAVAMAPQEAIEGDMTLLPVQRLMLGMDDRDRHHYNQAVLLTTPAAFHADVLPAVLRALYVRHDALRLRFSEGPQGWHAWHVPFDEATIDAGLAVEDMPDDRGSTAAFVTSRCDTWQRRFDLHEGPLLRVVYFKPAQEGEAGRLLLLAHHLVVDGVSWRILMADLERAYLQAAAARPIWLEAKTSSLKQWSEALDSYAHSATLAREKAFWLAQLTCPVAALPVDRPTADVGCMVDNRIVSATLDAASTRALQQESHTAYRTRINDLLLAGVYLAMRRWTGGTAMRLRMEGHGREALFDGMDLTQTVGYFTSVYPLVVQCESDDVGEVIKAAKEQSRNVRDHGMGYGVLRHLAGDVDLADAERAAGDPDFEFNYLGQFDQVVNEATAFQAAPEGVGDKVGPARRRVRRIGMSAKVFEGELSIVLDYSQAQYDASTMHGLVDGIVEGLRQVVAHCRQPGVGSATPSDFPIARIGQAELDAWQDRYGKIANVYPSTPMQAGLHYHSQIDPSAYVVQSYPIIRGELDVEAFRAAWTDVVARHDILRTAFEGKADTLHQVVLEHRDLPWHAEDWRGLGAAEQDLRFAAYREADAAAGFDFSRPPLLRLAIFRLAGDRYRLLWTQHHITMDGWSGPLLYRDVLARYRARTDGGPDGLEAPAVYGDYVAWLLRQNREAAHTWWRNSLANIPLPTPLPFDGLPTGGEHGQREQRMVLTRDATLALQSLAQKWRVTVNTLLQWSWAYVLHVCSGEADVVFGTTVSGRPAEVPGIETMVGLFINTIPVAVHFDEAASISEDFTRLHGWFNEASSHAFLSLPEIQQQSGGRGADSLFDSLLVFENLPGDARDKAVALQARLEIERESAPQFTHYRITLIAVMEDALLVRFGYQAEHYGDKTVERLMATFQRVLNVLPDAVATGRRPSLIGADDVRAIERWNATTVDYPSTMTIPQRFEACVRTHPDAPALSAVGQSLTYSELDACANRLAHGLLAKGVLPDDRVGIHAARGVDMIVAMLGVLKAGAAYLPLDPALPRERLDFLIADASPVIILSDTLLSAGESVVLPLEASAWTGWQATDPIVASATSRDLAYVMYTSGSTGTPKGVMIEHRNVLRLVVGTDYAPLGPGDCVAHCANPAFDASTWEIWAPLLNGGRVLVVDHETVLDAAALRDALVDGGVTALWLTVGLFNAYVDTLAPVFPRLRHLLVGGDALDRRRIADLAGSAHAPERLVNGYGPTECTTFATTHVIEGNVDGSRPIPIGRPIANTVVHVLRGLEPTAVGVIGEICIGGDGLARGYLNHAELTASRFVETSGYGRIYRTGDLGRWLLDGTIEFIGRNDEQVKVRGFRVEPAEIALAIANQPGILDAVVVARAVEGGEKRLVAYVVLEGEVSFPALRSTMAATLPHYMVPAAFVALDRLPITANGKVDRAVLPEPEWSADVDYVEPSTATEKHLAAIWCDVLGLERIGTSVRFFDAGGHSLLATRVISSAQTAFDCPLKINDLFAYQTIAELATWIDALVARGVQDDTVEEDNTLEISEW